MFKLAGIDIFGYWKWLKETEQWTPQQRDEWRLRRLGDLLEHCWDNVPFYKEFWADHRVKIRRLSSLDELQAVKGIGKKKFERIRPLVSVTPDAGFSDRRKKAT